VIDPGELQQVVTNLINNSLQAMGRAGGGILASVWTEGPTVNLAVEDTGPGIPQEVLGRVFEPFFTTKAWGRYRPGAVGVLRNRGSVARPDRCIEPPGRRGDLHRAVPRGTARGDGRRVMCLRKRLRDGRPEPTSRDPTGCRL